MSNGKTWSEDELDLVFSKAPTKENAKVLAKAFDVKPGAVELLWRFSNSETEAHANNSHVKKIKAARKRNWIV